MLFRSSGDAQQSVGMRGRILGSISTRLRSPEFEPLLEHVQTRQRPDRHARRSILAQRFRRSSARCASARCRTRLECRLSRACLSADEIYRLARAQNLSRSRCTAWASLQQTSTATAALTQYARSALQPGPGIFLCAYCPRRICRLHCACASAAPLSLLTLLVCCCVRSDDAETNESIG